MDAYYIPTRTQKRYEPDFYAHMFGKVPPRYFTSQMPDTPIVPFELASKVLEYLEAYGNTIHNTASSQVEALCKLFNHCITHNQMPALPKLPLKFVYSAQTGSAKSLTLKLYVSMLKSESSLIVVSRIDEALSYCRFINEVSGDEEYARCQYTVSAKNSDDPLRVELFQLNQYRCIVVSHAMFKKINQGTSLNSYRLYNNKQRDLVVIDEKLNFFEKTIVDFRELESLCTRLTSFLSLGGDFNQEMITQTIKMLLLIRKCYQQDKATILKSSLSPLFCIELFDLDLDIKEVLHNALELLNKRIEQLFEELYAISNLTNQHYQSGVSQEIASLIERMQMLFATDSYIDCYSKGSKESFFRVDSIINKLGNCVILDATAQINEIYKLAFYYERTMHNVVAEQTRTYSNLKIFTAKGYPQGRHSIYQGIDKEALIKNTQMYLSYIYGVLRSKDDKVLVIAHKTFRRALEVACNDSRVLFTHWGDHVGKNDWNDCNKVMVIGWNFLDPLEHVCQAFSALGDSIRSCLIDNKLIEKISLTQLADDIIQGLMRSQARKIATTDGDCEPTEVYLFCQERDDYASVLEILASQLPQAQWIDWSPVRTVSLREKSKTIKNIDTILTFLDERLRDHQTVMLKDIVHQLVINKSTLSRALNHAYFKEQLAKRSFQYMDLNGKSKYFVLK